MMRIETTPGQLGMLHNLRDAERSVAGEIFVESKAPYTLDAIPTVRFNQSRKTGGQFFPVLIEAKICTSGLLRADIVLSQPAERITVGREPKGFFTLGSPVDLISMFVSEVESGIGFYSDDKLTYVEGIQSEDCSVAITGLMAALYNHFCGTKRAA